MNCVLLCADKNYINPSIIAIRSVVDSATVEHIYVYCGDYETYETLASCCDIRVKLIPAWDKFDFVLPFKGTDLWSASALRMFAIKIFAINDLCKKGVSDQILYIDCDTVYQCNEDDIKFLALQTEFPVYGVPEMQYPELYDEYVNSDFEAIRTEWRRRAQYCCDIDKYINSGVLLVNCDLFNREFPHTETLESVYLQTQRHYRLPDQDFINYRFKSCIGILPSKYNAMADHDLCMHKGHYGASLTKLRLITSAVIHYHMSAKPWNVRKSTNTLLVRVRNPILMQVPLRLYQKHVKLNEKHLTHQFIVDVNKNVDLYDS